MELKLATVTRKKITTRFGDKVKLYCTVVGEPGKLYTMYQGKWNTGFDPNMTVSVGDVKETGRGTDRNGNPMVYYDVSAPEETKEINRSNPYINPKPINNNNDNSTLVNELKARVDELEIKVSDLIEALENCVTHEELEG